MLGQILRALFTIPAVMLFLKYFAMWSVWPCTADTVMFYVRYPRIGCTLNAPCKKLRYAKYLTFYYLHSGAPCQKLRYAKYLTCLIHVRYFAMRSIWHFTAGAVRFCVRYFAMRSIWPGSTCAASSMSETSLCEVSDLLLLVLWCSMSDTSLCEVSDIKRLGTNCTWSDTSLCEVSDMDRWTHQ